MASNQNNDPNKIKKPNEFWTVASFENLAVCVGIAYIVTSVFVGLFKTPSQMTAFIVSIVVSYARIILTNKLGLKKVILAFFNGFLLYFTLIGATSHFSLVNEKTADQEYRKNKPIAAAFFTPIVQDRNVIKKANESIKKANSFQTENISLNKEIDSLKNSLETRESAVEAYEKSFEDFEATLQSANMPRQTRNLLQRKLIEVRTSVRNIN